MTWDACQMVFNTKCAQAGASGAAGNGGNGGRPNQPGNMGPEPKPMWTMYGCFQNEGEMFTAGPGEQGGNEYTVDSCMEECQFNDGNSTHPVWALSEGMCFCGDNVDWSADRYP